ncbi:NAD-dependent epimerase/dehydratase family protein [Shewanella sp. ENK2]|uniref:NAD-dependent epimerase/dehydratase family protein n=1 Tax=Shewanella sp. ENK2 TaxID=2775245 RepID=UPI00374A5665
MKTLLTGATGFVGRAVIESGIDLKIVIRKHETSDFSPFFNIEQLDKNTEWDNAFIDIDSVIHLAGLAHSNQFTKLDYETVNVEGTLNLAKQAAKSGVRRFVFVSSIGVNGTSTSNTAFRVDSTPCPQNDYAKSKLSAEKALTEIANETDMELVIVRPTLVYGPNAPGNFGALMRLIDKVPVLPFGLTGNKRDFISVQNLAHLLVTCTTHQNAAGRIFLASEGETVSIKQFTNAIAKGLGRSLYQIPVPVGLMRFVGKLIGKHAMVEQLVGNLQVDSSNAQEMLGWIPPYTMEQAMASLSENKK